MALTRQDAVEGYFIDANNRMTRATVEDPERDQARFVPTEEARTMGGLMLGGAEVQLLY